MPYDDLRKIYYSDPKHYEDIYHMRYNSPYAQHIDFMINDNPAFLVVTPKIHSHMLSIYKLEKKILLACESLPGVALQQFFRRCLIDEIVLTNNIEGVHSTRREIDGILVNLEKQDKNMRFKGLVQKYLMLQSNTEIPLTTCEDVRKIYDDLVLYEITEDDPKNVPDGRIFRKDSVSVQSATQTEIHKGLYPESKIIDAMKKALLYLNDESVEPLYRISVFHYLLGYIHPFYDGNGRLNRFISSYLLSKELHPALGYRLSYTIRENLRKYYDGFKTCNDPKNLGDLTQFVQMFLEIIEESTAQLFSALEKRATRLKHYRGKIKYLPNSDNLVVYDIYHFLIQAELFSDHGISTQELLDNTDLSRVTLKKRLDEISELRLLKLIPYERDKRGKYYGINLEMVEQYGEGS